MHFGFHVICLWNSGREQKSHMFPSTIVKQQQLDAPLILEGWKKSDKMVNGRSEASTNTIEDASCATTEGSTER